MKQLQIDELYGRALYEHAGKVLVCGSRTARLKHVPLIEAELRLFPKSTAIIHGGNGVYDTRGQVIGGADMLADWVASYLGLSVTVFPVSTAEWNRFGTFAGPLRNRRMLDTGPGLVLAFWDGRSRGTHDAMSEARRRGIPVRVIEIDC